MHDWIVPTGINLLDFEAFVYRIWNVKTLKAYIGCKIVYGRRKGKRVVSDYLKYWGSSDELNDEIAQHGLTDFRREVLHVCRTRHEAVYLEAQEQFARNVLTAKLPNGQRAYWNNNILRSFFAARGQFQEQKRAYARKPLTCKCGTKVSFAKRHTEHCSARCLQLYLKKVHEEPKPKPKSKSRQKESVRTTRAKTGIGKVSRRTPGATNPAPI